MIYEWLTAQEKVLKIREMQIKTIIHLTYQDGYYQKDNKQNVSEDVKRDTCA